MKYTALVLAGTLVMAGTSATAQVRNAERMLYVPGSYAELNIPNAVLNYMGCLESPVQGIVESSLGHVIWLKLVRPDVDLEPIKEEITRLVTDGQTPCIRYRASLAAMVFDAPEIFAGMTTAPYPTGNELFAAVASRAKVILVSDNR